MPSWDLHEKWCQALGISRAVCEEVNRTIDRVPHDIEDEILKQKWLREAFRKGKIRHNQREAKEIGKTFSKFFANRIHEELFCELTEITNKFGEEGIKATFCHIALDRVAELIMMGMKKEKIMEGLREKGLINYIVDFDKVFQDISKKVKPIPHLIKRRETFEKLAKLAKGVYGVFSVNRVNLSPLPALLKIESELRKGDSVEVEWGENHYVVSKRRAKIKKVLHSEEDMMNLIEDIKKRDKR